MKNLELGTTVMPGSNDAKLTGQESVDTVDGYNLTWKGLVGKEPGFLYHSKKNTPDHLDQTYPKPTCMRPGTERLALSSQYSEKVLNGRKGRMNRNRN